MEVVLTDSAPQKAAGMSVESLDHIAIAVPDLAEAINFYRDQFGCFVSDPKELPEQGIRIAYVELRNASLELMEPLGSNSPISKFLENHPAGGLHHFCLTTEDVFKAVATAKHTGMRVLGGDNLTIGHHGKKLFFIHPKDTHGSLIEIEETLNQG